MPKIGELPGAKEALGRVQPKVVRPTECWVGGRVFLDEFGEEVFVPLGQSRESATTSKPLTFLGDGVRNSAGWSTEIRITNPVQGAV